MGVRSYTLIGRGRSKPLSKTPNIMNVNIVSLIMAVLAMATQTLGLYLGTGGVVGKSITPRTGSSFPARFSTSGGRSRSRDYGVIYGKYRPSGIRPSSSKGK